ncbi:MAG: Rieske 2Fe-2S domain-containing protein [Xanthomonadales bacterium]|nr:Rieske 2Fe-2S domain-containing protein [Xanthomonadales bacterium]
MQYLCQQSEITSESGREFRLDVEGHVRFVAVFRTANGIRAYLNSCPHQGRSLNWAPDQFLFTDDGKLVCAHHGATFDVGSGTCVSGPCPGASLTPVDIELKDGSVYFVSAPTFA